MRRVPEREPALLGLKGRSTEAGEACGDVGPHWLMDRRGVEPAPIKSMANPQLEDGYTSLANEIVEALARTNLTGYQGRVLWAIWRKTYGWHKKEDWISNGQLVEQTGIAKQHVSRTVKELRQRNIVTKSGNKLGFNKDYTQWRELPRQVTVTSSGNKVTNPGSKVTSLGEHKRNYQKKITKRKPACAGSDSFSSEDKEQKQPESSEITAEVQTVIDHYYEVYQREFGEKPKGIGKPDAGLVQAALKEFTLDQVKSIVDFGVDTIKGKDGMVVTLKACMGNWLISAYQQEWARRKWQYEGTTEPPLDKVWWKE